MPLPEIFITRLSEMVPPKLWDAVMASFSEPPPPSFRVNTLKQAPSDTFFTLEEEGFEVSPVSWCHSAATLPTAQRILLRDHALSKEGVISLQGLSSLVPVLCLAPQPENEVLDLTAAPGGKTCHMAALMHNRGRIGAVEGVKARFHRLLAMIKQQGVTNVSAYCRDGTQLYRACPERFDHVLLDAPCSTEAQFQRNDPSSYAHWHLKKICEVARKQRQLLYSALQCVQVGGSIVYSTCSFAPEENECQIDWILRRFPGCVDVAPISLDIPELSPGLVSWQQKALHPDCGHTARIWPDGRFSGFYVAKLIKRRQLASPLDRK